MPHPFTSLDGLVVPLDRANVDTDAIIPKQFMKSIRRTGFGDNLFDEWRYLDHGEPGQDCSARPLNLDFVLNQPRYQGAQILLARENFGCGSSREHAPWALRDFGIRALVAPSFGDIFYGNCLKNGLLPIVLDKPMVDELFGEVRVMDDYRLAIDLASQTVATPTGTVLAFEIEPGRKRCLLDGLDDIALTLQREARIHEYEARRRELEPWLFNDSLPRHVR
jgi:3-isopropylmalate/(R)-2-methylmalate dehydratase small subunit